jgi:NAD(P)-dependent dehydrogenase (short-subunit alcohol dehydrogenase family)
MYNLSGRVSLVTGAARGIGFGIALELARAGSRVVVTDYDVQKAADAVDAITRAGYEAIAIGLDVTDAHAVRSCVQTAIERCLHVDILVNNAGVHCETIGEPSRVEHFNRCFEVNLLGVWRMTEALVSHFKAQRGGRIINIASINGRKPWADTPAYSASKAALINLTQSLAMKLGAHNIQVNAICPGGVMTAMADRFKERYPTMLESIIDSRALKRALQPADIGRAAVFFASSDAKSITGQSLNVDCGTVMS